MSTETGLCRFCSTEQQVKRDGTLAKHLVGGEVCEGWNTQPADPPDSAVCEDDVATDTGDERADEPVDDGWDDDEDAAERPDEDPSPQALHAPAEGDGVYRWQLTVRHPAIYLGDPAWHHQNGLAAAAAAEQAGHTVTGEAKWARDSGGGHDEATVLLTYLVTVQQR